MNEDLAGIANGLVNEAVGWLTLGLIGVKNEEEGGRLAKLTAKELDALIKELRL